MQKILNATSGLKKLTTLKMYGYSEFPSEVFNKENTDNWISRFEVWPYLEQFAEDSYKELMKEFGTRPDLVIGNYSDGNLVATILAKKVWCNSMQCCTRTGKK